MSEEDAKIEMYINTDCSMSDIGNWPCQWAGVRKSRRACPEDCAHFQMRDDKMNEEKEKIILGAIEDHFDGLPASDIMELLSDDMKRQIALKHATMLLEMSLDSDNLELERGYIGRSVKILRALQSTASIV